MKLSLNHLNLKLINKEDFRKLITLSREYHIDKMKDVAFSICYTPTWNYFQYIYNFRLLANANVVYIGFSKTCISFNFLPTGYRYDCILVCKSWNANLRRLYEPIDNYIIYNSKEIYYDSYYGITLYEMMNINKIALYLYYAYLKLSEVESSIPYKVYITKRFENIINSFNSYFSSIKFGDVKSFMYTFKCYLEKLEELIKWYQRLREKARIYRKIEKKPDFTNEISQFIDFIHLRFEEGFRDYANLVRLDDVLIDYGNHAGIVVTESRDRKKIIILSYYPKDDVMIKVIDKKVKRTGTLYKMIIYVKSENRLLNVLVIKDNSNRFSILYSHPLLWNLPIDYDDVYCMGLVRDIRDLKHVVSAIGKDIELIEL